MRRARQAESLKGGFTMVELLFAMSFVAVLLILILTATIQIAKIYNKGISLKQVNQSGIQVGNDLRAAIKAADAPIDTASVADGRLCLGSYSYVWNTGDNLINKYAGGDAETRIGLVKITDPGRKVCDDSGAHLPVQKAAARELLVVAGDGANDSGSSGVSLRLRAMSVSEVAKAGLGNAYAVSYTLSTDDNSLITADSTACKGGQDDEFCALNEFHFTTYAHKGGSGAQ